MTTKTTQSPSLAAEATFARTSQRGQSSREARMLPKQSCVFQPFFPRVKLRRRRDSAAGGREPPSALSDDSRQLRQLCFPGVLKVPCAIAARVGHAVRIEARYDQQVIVFSFSLVPGATHDRRHGSHHRASSNVVRNRAAASPVQTTGS